MVADKLAARFLAKVARRLVNGFVRRKPDLLRLGTTYGGWEVPRQALKPGNVAFCAGAGEDISFDVELNAAGLRVVTVDPTPRSIAHVEGLLAAAESGAPFPINRSETEYYTLANFDRSTFTFVPLGLWNEKQTMRFYAPENPDHVSHSIHNMQETESYFDAQCDTTTSIMKKNKIDRVDIIKLDIEGAEYNVIDNLIETNVLPTCILVEFEELINPQGLGFINRIRRMIQNLKKCEYKLYSIDGANFCFLRTD